MKFIYVFFTAALLLSACNTVEGIGQDLEELGNGLKNEANEKR